MTPLEVFLVAALTGVGGYAAWVTKAYIAHLLTDNDRLWKTADRGTTTAEKVVSLVADK